MIVAMSLMHTFALRYKGLISVNWFTGNTTAALKTSILIRFCFCGLQLKAAVPETAAAEEEADLLRVRGSQHDRLPHVPLNFNNGRAAFETKSNLDILRTWSVLTACQIQPLVNNADSLLAWSKRVLGSTVVNGIIKHTFFNHFCAGTNQEDIKPALQTLHASGIGAILDYAAGSTSVACKTAGNL